MDAITRLTLHAKLHPGETPLQYRERIGHVSKDPKTWGDLEQNPDAHPEGIFIAYDCGCQVVGNGTIPYPISILRCERHDDAALARAAALIEKLADRDGITRPNYCGYCYNAKGGHESDCEVLAVLNLLRGA